MSKGKLLKMLCGRKGDTYGKLSKVGSTERATVTLGKGASFIAFVGIFKSNILMLYTFGGGGGNFSFC